MDMMDILFAQQTGEGKGGGSTFEALNVSESVVSQSTITTNISIEGGSVE